jgi:hypothetical protein
MRQTEPAEFQPSFLGTLGQLLGSRSDAVPGIATDPYRTAYAYSLPGSFGADVVRGSTDLSPGQDRALEYGALAGDLLMPSLLGTGLVSDAAKIFRNPNVVETLGALHRGPSGLRPRHPRDVEMVSGNAIGPGFYVTPRDTERAGIGSLVWGGGNLPGDRSSLYRMSGSIGDLAKIAKSRGYATYDDMQRAIREIAPGSSVRDMTVDNPVVRKLQQEGFIGYAPTGFGPSSPEFTNWLVGARDIGRINPSLPSLGVRDVTRLTAMQNALQGMGSTAAAATRRVTEPVQSAARSVGEMLRRPVDAFRQSQSDRAASEAARKAAEETAKIRQSLLPPPPPR